LDDLEVPTPIFENTQTLLRFNPNFGEMIPSFTHLAFNRFETTHQLWYSVLVGILRMSQEREREGISSGE